MTVGNQARIQLGVAQVQAKYGNQLDSLYGSMMAKRYKNNIAKYSGSTKTLDELLKSNKLKNQSEEFRSQFSQLYKSIFGINDDGENEEGYSTPQSIKAASAEAGGAAQSIQDFAEGLKYGGELDVEAYKKQAQNFVDSYNSMVEKVGNAENANVLQKGVLMVNSTKVYSSALKRAGITVGADNKLSLMEDLSNVKASDVKVTFGRNGYSDKVIQKARQINTLSGGSGFFTKGVSGSTSTNKTENSDKVDNSGTLKEMTEAVKDAATAVKSYVHGLGSEENSFSPTDFTKTAKDFVEKYNSFVDEMSKSNNTSVRQKGAIMQSTANAYKHALKRVGISVGNDFKLTLDESAKITEQDAKYAFGYGGFLDKVTQKADQVKSLVSSASAMGYGADKISTYAYNIGALFSTYA